MSKRHISLTHVFGSVVQFQEHPLFKDVPGIQLQQGIVQREIREDMANAKIEDQKSRGLENAFPAPHKGLNAYPNIGVFKHLIEIAKRVGCHAYVAGKL